MAEIKKLIKNGSSLKIVAKINSNIQPMLNPSLPLEMCYFQLFNDWPIECE